MEDPLQMCGKGNGNKIDTTLKVVRAVVPPISLYLLVGPGQYTNAMQGDLNKLSEKTVSDRLTRRIQTQRS